MSDFKPIEKILISRTVAPGCDPKYVRTYFKHLNDFLNDGYTCYSYMGFTKEGNKGGYEIEYDPANLSREEMNEKDDSILYLSFHDYKVSLYDCCIK